MAEQQSSVAILCGGPSLNAFLGSPADHTLYIGVNLVVTAWKCDWWAFSDAAAFSMCKPLGCPRIFTSETTYGRLPPQRSDYVCLTHEDVNTDCPRDKNWRNYSMLTAMILAAHLIEQQKLAATISIYGCDWTEGPYWDGTRLRDHSAQYRFKNEQHWYGHVEGWLATRGIPTTREMAA